MLTDKKRDWQLRHRYSIGLSLYGYMLAEQKGVCAICKRPPGSRSLHVDHDHRLPKLKLTVVEAVASPGYYAYVKGYPSVYGSGATKKEARDKFKDYLKRKANRGLVCWQCNAGLRQYHDDPDILESAANYLRKYYERVPLANMVRPKMYDKEMKIDNPCPMAA